MKILAASDIHGSALYCRQLLERFSAEKPDMLLLLGDILYHGPRNDLPDGYAPKEVIAMLNPLKGCISCVRGNCDAEVDQMVLDFPIMADYCIISLSGRTVFATHGHIYNLDSLPPLAPGGILLHGHTHVQACVESQGILYVNPGSVSLPKADSFRGYMTLEDGGLTWKDLDGNTRMRRQL